MIKSKEGNTLLLAVGIRPKMLKQCTVESRKAQKDSHYTFSKCLCARAHVYTSVCFSPGN